MSSPLVLRRPLRVAVVHSYYSSRQASGENHVVEQQVAGLARAGFCVRLLAQHTDRRERSMGYTAVAAATVATGRGPSPLAGLREFDPHLVLVHNLFPNYGRRWVFRWPGPMVAVIHNYRPLCAAATFYRDGHTCTDCLNVGSSLPAIRHACYRGSRLATAPVAAGTKFGDDPLLRRADRVVVLNRQMRTLYARAGVGEPRLREVPNFLEAPGAAGQGGGPWLFVGRLTEEKGILELLRQWPSGVPLVVVGSGPQAEAAAKVAPAGVSLVGEQRPDRVRELMRSARGLVFPSRWFEGAPMVYVEALAAGTPVLAWKPSSVAEMVLAEGTGRVVGSLPEALAEADGVFPSMRRRCRAVFEERYTREAWITSMTRVFDEALDARSRCAGSAPDDRPGYRSGSCG